MKLPEKGWVDPGPPISTRPLDKDPGVPHVWRMASSWGECLICGGSRNNPIHMEPLGGWPK